MITPTLVVLCGGTSSEREVSLGSGMPCAIALSRTFPTRRVVVDADALPPGLDPSREVIFSTLHGTFGEDGGMQHLLEQAGLQYAGSDAAASALTFDKERTKQVVSAAGVAVAPGISFSAGAKPTRAEIVAKLGHQVVFKPRASGSSVGLAICENLVAMEAKLAEISSGEWIVERRIVGREVTVGILNGRAMGVVEIIPDSGIFDYRSKYTKGLTQYRAPAPLSETRTRAVQAAAQTAFQACGCRDYARIDFMLSEEGEFFLLEINTLPGMKETSLLPMSAQCVGLDFTALVRELVAPAVRRFQSSGVLANSL
ncbi:MAG TPA: D-alanine--D-alanine ligase [Opitutaceae bacterium]|nr:D-alanine--D-alanine ligase [Opitutaceae bacterium]